MAKGRKEEEMFKRIDSRPAMELTEEEKAGLAEAEAMDDGTMIDLEDFKKELEEYSGHVVVRMPRSLHKRLKEAAAVEGVSLNQYIIYKLA